VGKAIILAVAAGFFTAVSSICQRRGASRVPDGGGFDVKLILRLLGEPVWLLGVASMILGFVCQATALHFGNLALVQPILASELLFVFGYIAVVSPRRVRLHDWLAAAAMAGGLGVFLLTASPSRGQAHAAGNLWWLGGLSCLGLIVVMLVAAYTPLRRGTRPSPARRAALLGVATGISWGFLAAVIKELSTRTGHGVAGIFSAWSLYVLVVVGAVSMILASNALQAGPLPASQPGFTIVDPLVASLLGIFIFKDRLQLHPFNLAVEIVALAALALGVVALSHSGLVHGEPAGRDDPGTESTSACDPLGPLGHVG
jgi:drug/metabolite transporter (DMT)-like permease